MGPLPVPGQSSPKPFGISSSKSPSLVDNVAGVMPPPNNLNKAEDNSHKSPPLLDNAVGVIPPPKNLDKAEDDSHIPENENGPGGKNDLQDDDQNPDGQIDETVDLDKQQFLQDEAEKEDTKDVIVEGLEEGNSLNIL